MGLVTGEWKPVALEHLSLQLPPAGSAGPWNLHVDVQNGIAACRVVGEVFDSQRLVDPRFVYVTGEAVLSGARPLPRILPTPPTEGWQPAASLNSSSAGKTAFDGLLTDERGGWRGSVCRKRPPDRRTPWRASGC